jgi:C-terminal processing protease CtpA/Prc
MRLALALLTLLAVNLSQVPLFGQPSQSDRYKYAPLLSAAKLWNMIRYLHPRVTGDSTAWDSALIAALPKIENSHSDEELAIALDAMLATLHDPCTRIAFGMPGKGVSVQSVSDAMVIHAGNGDLSGSMGAGLMLRLGIPQSNSIVWDIRGSRMPFQISARPDISQLSLNGIGYAYREHSGYVPQEGQGSRFYSSSLRIVDPQPAASRQTAIVRRQVYLIDKDSAVPMQAIIDQVHGRTAIVSEDPPAPLQAGITELVKVLGKVVAEVRVAELRYADGTTNFAPSRVVLNRGEEAIKAGVDLLSGGWSMPGERPEFDPGPSGFRDMPYADHAYPSRELRILAALRIWGILHYFHPYVSTMGEKWDDTLVEFLPKFSEAANEHDYHFAVAAMVARVGDPGTLARSSEMADLFGSAAPPFEIRFIENQPVISRIFKPSPAQQGDVILKIDGKPVQDRIDELSRYLAAPTQTMLQSQVMRFLLAAKASGQTVLNVRGKDGKDRDITIALNDTNQRGTAAARAGDSVRLINERIGYADVERLEAADLDMVIEKFRQTSAIVFDFRGYPKDGVLTIASRLGERNHPVAAEIFHNVMGMAGDVGGNDSHISFSQSELRIPRGAKLGYAGKIVVLIDDRYPSLAGESAMCLKGANNIVLIGSAPYPFFAAYRTMFEVPGGVKVYFSGQVPRWPNGKLLYPDGVQPDIEVKSTITGLRDGRDEVLDAAVAYLSKN